jgi:hypothetical protein
MMLIGLTFGLSLATQNIALPQPAPQIVQVEYVLPAQRVVVYAPDANLQMTSQAILSPEAQAAFDAEFAIGTYFGAFAMSKDGGWGYSLGSNSLDAARAIAIAQCASVNTTRCVVVAEITPVGYQPPAPGEVAVSPEVYGYYSDTTTNVKAYAMAISEDGAYSKIWGVASQAEADAQVLADCNAQRMTEPAGLIDMPCFLLP